jgi:hypothetical protein
MDTSQVTTQTPSATNAQTFGLTDLERFATIALLIVVSCLGERQCQESRVGLPAHAAGALVAKARVRCKSGQVAPDDAAPANEAPDQFLYNAYGAACAWASVLELKIRMLADNTPSLKTLAHASKLEDIETAIVTTFAASLLPGEAALFEKARQVRNKVVHGNFSRAKAMLLELGFEISAGGVFDIDASGPCVIDAILRGEGTPVAETETKDSSIYGWLIEATMSGLFAKAVEVFQKTAAVVERLALK